MSESNESAYLASAGGDGVQGGISLWQGVILAGLVAYLFLPIVAELVTQWRQDPNFSHGFLVPIFSLFLVWQKRKVLSSLPRSSSWWGLMVVTGALLILIVGVLGAEYFLSRSSLVFLVAGLVILFYGWACFRAILFAWAVLFLMIPIPAIIFNEISFPLQLLSSYLASSLLGLIGVPVLQEGNVIRLPAMSLEVVEACSGIRSLFTLVTLALIYGYFFERGVLRRGFLAAAAVPIAVGANGLRVMGTGLLAYYWSLDKATGFFHNFSGWVIFVLSLGMLFCLHGVMRAVRGWRAARKV